MSASVVISVAAFAVSLSTFLTSRRRDKRDLLLRVQERLTTADQQRGRRLIYSKVARGIRPEDLTEDEYSVINNALVLLDAVGIYYRRRFISRNDILELWALTVVRLVRAGEPFMTDRDERLGANSLPHLRVFAADAERYLVKHGTPVKAIDIGPAGSPNPAV